MKAKLSIIPLSIKSTIIQTFLSISFDSPVFSNIYLACAELRYPFLSLSKFS